MFNIILLILIPTLCILGLKHLSYVHLKREQERYGYTGPIIRYEENIKKE